MRAVNDFIVETNVRYNNEIDLGTGTLVVNTEISERDHTFVNRVGRVVGLPVLQETPVDIGDYLIIHHNVFRRWYDVRGQERNSSSYIDEDRYRVGLDQVYGYNKGDGWLSVPGYCFVVPLEERSGLLNQRIQLRGKIKYGDASFVKDDIVCFTPASEYEFEIDGEKLYRVRTQDITVRL